MNQQLVRRKINQKNPERKPFQIPKAVLKLLEALGKIELPKLRTGRYTRHQGPRECARRVRQMQRQGS